MLLGLVVGSFIGAVTWRIPKQQGFVKGRSYCDNCKKELRWSDNIPLFSFLFYGGISRCCNKKISTRYPLIELTTAIGFVVLYFSFGFSLLLLKYYLLLIVTLSILVIDLEHQIIPDELSWLILFIFFIFAVPHTLFANLFSGFLFSLVLLILYLSTGGRGMGLGDVKLAIPIGLLLGFEKGFMCWVVAFSHDLSYLWIQMLIKINFKEGVFRQMVSWRSLLDLTTILLLSFSSIFFLLNQMDTE